MYQSVGQDAVHLIAQAMDLPLYRSEITGQALDQSADYEQGLKPRPHDEAESLTVLLKDVLVRPKSCSTPLLYLLKVSAFDRAIRANTLKLLLSPWVPYFPTISAYASRVCASNPRQTQQLHFFLAYSLDASVPSPLQLCQTWSSITRIPVAEISGRSSA